MTFSTVRQLQLLCIPAHTALHILLMLSQLNQTFHVLLNCTFPKLKKYTKSIVHEYLPASAPLINADNPVLLRIKEAPI
jgi:hypothetical protein